MIILCIQGFGIQPAEIVRNFVASDHAHFVEDQDFNPIVYAEQFTDPDASKAQAPEELLRRARMILSTELGRDPLLRQEMRNTFKENALVSVLPTEKGKVKIDEHHLYFVRYSLTPSTGKSDFSSELQVSLSKTCQGPDRNSSVPSHRSG